jgi:hypothetical protein
MGVVAAFLRSIVALYLRMNILSALLREAGRQVEEEDLVMSDKEQEN